MEETASTGELAMMEGMALTPMRWLGQAGGEGSAQAQWRGCRRGWRALMARRRGEGGSRVDAPVRDGREGRS